MTGPRDDLLGATPLEGGRCRFLLWAPLHESVQVVVLGPDGASRAAAPMELDPSGRGYHRAILDGVRSGDRYRYQLPDGRELPDPASRFQPQGVHGPSQVVDLQGWSWEDDGWIGLLLRELVTYELHVGAFTPEGTFDAVVQHLDQLKDLGITAIELMPVAQFPGERNWGYDGTYPFAVQVSYGGPDGLRRLVDQCHRRGMAVVLDVVYNHLGPEGNYSSEYAPYFTDRYRTPWGQAINVDGPGSDEVRRYLMENALQWMEDFHVDALRLDAIQGIVDNSANPFLAELGQAVEVRAEELGRRLHLVAESDLGDVRVVTPRDLNGLGMDAQWMDDFHHSVHALLTGERNGYYADFGSVGDLALAYRQGFVYTGQYSVARGRRHGTSPHAIPATRLVVCIQNHDQVANHRTGERLFELVGFERAKLAAGALLLSPYLPLLFMGEEYGEIAPFQYFVHHSDPALEEGVREGRADEFRSMGWIGEPPDPQDEVTFLRCKLDHGLGSEGRHRTLRALYRELLRLRRECPPLANLSKDQLDVTAFEAEGVLLARRWIEDGEEEAMVALHVGEAPVTVPLPWGGPSWTKQLDSAEERWDGPGSPAPQQLRSDERQEATLGPNCVVLYLRASEPAPGSPALQEVL